MCLKTVHKDDLRTLNFFCKLSDHELDHICEHTNIVNVYKKEQLFAQFDEIKHFFFVLEGLVKLYRMDSNGNIQIINIAKKGAMFPHIGFFQTRTYPANAETMIPSRILCIPSLYMKETLLQYPAIYEQLYTNLEERLIDLQNRLEEKMLHPFSNQVVLALLRLSRSFGIDYQTGWKKLDILLSNRELASLVGSTREAMNRHLNSLKKKNIITYTDDGYLLINVRAAQKMVDLQE